MDLQIENRESSSIESTQREIISVIDMFTEAINTKNPEIVSDILDSELDKIKFYVKNDSSYHKKSSSSLDFLKTSENKFFENTGIQLLLLMEILQVSGHLMSFI